MQQPRCLCLHEVNVTIAQGRLLSCSNHVLPACWSAIVDWLTTSWWQASCVFQMPSAAWGSDLVQAGDLEMPRFSLTPIVCTCGMKSSAALVSSTLTSSSCSEVQSTCC